MEKRIHHRRGRRVKQQTKHQTSSHRQDSSGGRYLCFCLQVRSVCWWEEFYGIEKKRRIDEQEEKNQIGKIFTITGLLLFAAALALSAYNLWDGYRAEQSREKLLEEYRDKNQNISDEGKQADESDGQIPNYQLNPEMEMPEIALEDLDGAACIGVLEIPAIDLKLPVLSEWSYPLLKKASCRYSGSAYLDNLVIAGGSSDTDSFMEELKELAKGDDRILFTGFVQGAMLDELYSNTYIYTLPSDLEGMPLSLLEAMSYGNCCLVSDIPECAEVVEDKALIFKKSDVEDLREKLQDACDHPEMVMRMKNQAADFICEKYNWDEVARETMKLYRRK